MKYYHFIWIVFLASCYANDELPRDQEIWGYANPAEVGLSESLLLNTDERIKNGDFFEVKSLIILKDDQIVFENYYDDSFRSQLRPLGFSTSILTVAALGEIINDGFIKSIDDPIYEYMPAYFNVFDAQPEKKEITIRHILTNRSGLVWTESNSLQSTSNDLYKMKNTSDWVSYVIKKDMEAPPGVRLVTNSAGNIILTSIMQFALGDVDLKEYITERILKPIQINEFVWEADPAGNLDGVTGLSTSDIDFVKIGYLFANYGLWKRKRILNENWVYEMMSIKTNATVFYDTGFGWRSFSAELASYYGLGAEEIFISPVDFGQALFLVPRQNLVIMIYAQNYFYDFYSPTYNLFNEIFVPSIN